MSSQTSHSARRSGSLPVLEKPEWTDVPFDKDYAVTCKILEEKILLVEPRGFASYNALKSSREFVDRVLHEHFGKAEQFVLVEDIRAVEGFSKRARNFFIEHITAKPQIDGLIFCCTSPPLSLGIKLAFKLNPTAYEKHLVLDRDQALTVARRILAGQEERNRELTLAAGNPPPGADPVRDSDDDFYISTLARDGGITHYSLLEGDVYHIQPEGKLRADSFDQVFAKHQERIRAWNLRSNAYYLVMNGNQLTGSSRKARQQYLDMIKTLYRDCPFCMFIFYGLNDVMQATVSVFRPFVSFEVNVVESFEDALALIGRHRQARANPPDKMVGEKDTGDSTARYVDQLLRHVGCINWEMKPDEYEIEQIGSEHPFKQVFDAISIISNDLNEAFLEQQREKKINQALFQVSHAVNTTYHTRDLYQAIHTAIRDILDVTNFYIALYDPDSRVLRFPYFVDRVDKALPSLKLDHKKSFSLTVEVVTGQ